MTSEKYQQRHYLAGISKKHGTKKVLFTPQPDLFQLTHTIEYLRSRGWLNAVAADEEWGPGFCSPNYVDESALLVRKSEL